MTVLRITYTYANWCQAVFLEVPSIRVRQRLFTASTCGWPASPRVRRAPPHRRMAVRWGATFEAEVIEDRHFTVRRCHRRERMVPRALISPSGSVSCQ